MNAQRLMRQLRREIKANPKRAALLGGLCAIGIYSWAPLVAGWVMPKESGKGIVKASTKKSTPKATSPTQLDQTNQEQTKPQINTAWTELWAAIQDDNRTKPSATLAIATNPFRPFPEPEKPESENDGGDGSDPASKTAKGEAAKRNAAPVEVTPKSLGMKLTSTLISARRRAAVIDGKTVPEGAMVSSGGSDSKSKDAGNATSTNATFRLVRVERESIVLERNAKEYTLDIEKSADDGIEFHANPLSGL
jgi:hypothetical protein